jgi:hypothetical protein
MLPRASIPKETRRRADDEDNRSRDTQEQQRDEEARDYAARSPGGGCALHDRSHVRTNRSRLLRTVNSVASVRDCKRLFLEALSGSAPWFAPQSV